MYALTHTFGKISSFDSNHPTWMKYGKTATVATDVAIATTLFVVAALAFLVTDGVNLGQLSFLAAIGPGGSAVMIVFAASIMGVNHIVFAIDISFPPPQKQMPQWTASDYKTGFATEYMPPKTPGVPYPSPFQGKLLNFPTPTGYPTPFPKNSDGFPISPIYTKKGFPTPIQRAFDSPSRKEFLKEVEAQSVKLKTVSELPRIQSVELETLKAKLLMPTSRTTISTAVQEFRDYLEEKLPDFSRTTSWPMTIQELTFSESSDDFDGDIFELSFDEKQTYRKEDNCLHDFFVRLHAYVYGKENKTFDTKRIQESLDYLAKEIDPVISQAAEDAKKAVRERKVSGVLFEQRLNQANIQRWKEELSDALTKGITYDHESTNYDITTLNFKSIEKQQVKRGRVETELKKSLKDIATQVQSIKDAKDQLEKHLDSPTIVDVNLKSFEADCVNLKILIDKLSNIKLMKLEGFLQTKGS